MTTVHSPPTVLSEAVLDAMPIGVAIIDADMRIVRINPAYCDSVGMPPNSFPPGMLLEDALRASAHRGLYGPGDPEAQLAAIMAADRSRPGRLRRRGYNGRSFDLHNAPLPGGGHVVCAVETTFFLADRDEARLSLARVTRALATLRTGLAAFSADRSLLFCNPRFSDLLGLPPEPLQPGLAFTDLLTLMARLDDFTGHDGEMFLAGQRDIDRSRPNVVRRASAAGEVLDISSDPLPDGGWTVTVTDVSALARAEDEARRRAAILRSILDAVPHGVCVYSADGRVTMVNRAYNQVMGDSPVEVGERRADVVRRRAEAGEYGPGAPAELSARQLARDMARPQTEIRRRPNGMTVDVRTTPLPDGGYISAVTDITALTEAEAEVSRRASELAVMLSSIRQGVLLWGSNRQLIASNAVAAQLLSVPPDLLQPGRSADELLDSMLARGHFGAGEGAEERARSVKEANRTEMYQRQIITSQGRTLDLRSDPTGSGGWVTTFTDVTEARAAEAELRRAKETAEAANQAKSRFLATMSHELRTPLNAVIGFSDQLLREAARPTAGRVTEFARQINDAGRHLLDVVNLILDIARIESGRFDLASDKVDIARLVRLCIRQADAAAQAAEIIVSTEIQDNLPLVRADERRMQQVLTHLLSNAVKFTEAGGTVVIGASVEPSGGLLLFVRDTGIGIPAEDLERVFEPFTQLDSSLARRFPGAGLGLYVSRALIAGHGGELVLRSAPGQGTAAEIRLPRERLFVDDA